MKLWPIKINSGENLDPKSIHRKLRDPYRDWLILLALFIGTVIIGILISVGHFWTLFKSSGPNMQDTEEGHGLEINIDSIKNTINKRQQLLDRDISIPNDPSL